MEGGKGKRTVRLLLSGAVTAVILYYLIRLLARSWREAGVYHWEVDWFILAASLPVLALYFFLAAWIWKRILHSLDTEIGMGAACRVWFLSQMGKYIPGKIWYAMGRLYMSGQAGIGVIAASVSTVLELMLAIFAAAGVFLLSLPLWPAIGKTETILAGSVLLAIALFLHPALFRLLLRLACRILRRESIECRLAWRDLLTHVLWYGLTWILYGVGMELLFRSIRLEGMEGSVALGTGSRILFFAGAAGAAWVIGFVSIVTPSGLGVREATLGYLLAIHLPQPLPVLLALIARLWVTVGELGAALAGWIIGRSNRDT